jgi:hypothetical protein
MQLQNLYDPAVKQAIIDRINKLTPESQRKWGKMDVAQMLTHCQRPLGVATGKHQLKSGFFMRLIGPLFKSKLYNDRPFTRDLPTDNSFKVADPREFALEKQNLIDMINSFSETAMSGRPHPFFGKLTNEQWSRGSWKHLDHHLQQFGV